MRDAFICDAVRTPIGRYGGALAKVRTDDLAALPIRALMRRNPNADWSALDEVFYGCANRAGEDNRNVARMSLLLAGLPDSVPASGRACRWRWGRCNNTIFEKIGFGHFGRTKYPLFCVLYEGFTDT